MKTCFRSIQIVHFWVVLSRTEILMIWSFNWLYVMWMIPYRYTYNIVFLLIFVFINSAPSSTWILFIGLILLYFFQSFQKNYHNFYFWICRKYFSWAEDISWEDELTSQVMKELKRLLKNLGYLAQSKCKIDIYAHTSQITLMKLY